MHFKYDRRLVYPADGSAVHVKFSMGHIRREHCNYPVIPAPIDQPEQLRFLRLAFLLRTDIVQY